MGCNHTTPAWRCINYLDRKGNVLKPKEGKVKPNFFIKEDPCYNNEELFYKLNPREKGYEYLHIPCGKCKECRLNKSRDWANRCMQEMKQWDHNYFLTLTYDNEYLPTTMGVDVETGEVVEWGTLRFSDLTKFMKDLRRYYKYHFNHDNIREFACGEYGDKMGRPHFHPILFNLPIKDLEPHHRNKLGNMIYTSNTISKIWKKGIVGICEANWETACYTARYVMKKQKGITKGLVWFPGEKRLIAGLEPEGIRPSRKPGIGANYYKDNKDWMYENDEMFVKTKNGVQTVKPCSYYDRCFDMENPEEMKAIKERRRRNLEIAKKMKLLKTDLTEQEYDNMLEENKNIKIRRLKRGFEKGCG